MPTTAIRPRSWPEAPWPPNDVRPIGGRATGGRLEAGGASGLAIDELVIEMTCLPQLWTDAPGGSVCMT
jgi:hypothetical protein